MSQLDQLDSQPLQQLRQLHGRHHPGQQRVVGAGGIPHRLVRVRQRRPLLRWREPRVEVQAAFRAEGGSGPRCPRPAGTARQGGHQRWSQLAGTGRGGVTGDHRRPGARRPGLPAAAGRAGAGQQCRRQLHRGRRLPNGARPARPRSSVRDLWQPFAVRDGNLQPAVTLEQSVLRGGSELPVRLSAPPARRLPERALPGGVSRRPVAHLPRAVRQQQREGDRLLLRACPAPWTTATGAPARTGSTAAPPRPRCPAARSPASSRSIPTPPRRPATPAPGATAPPAPDWTPGRAATPAAPTPAPRAAPIRRPKPVCKNAVRASTCRRSPARSRGPSGRSSRCPRSRRRCPCSPCPACR